MMERNGEGFDTFNGESHIRPNWPQARITDDWIEKNEFCKTE